MIMAGNPECVIGLDIGGTKIRGGLITRDGKALRAVTQATDISGGRQTILASIDAVLADLTSGTPARAIGVATAGVVDKDSGVIVDATPNLPGWKHTALSDHIEQRWGLPVALENDGKATLIAELQDRPDLQTGIAVLLSLGTGLGGAIAIDGMILDGATNVTGHFGVTRGAALPDDDGAMPLEYYVSGSGLARLLPRCDPLTRVDSRTVLAGVRAGDRDAVVARDRWVGKLADTIGNVRWIVDPHWLILGGGVIDSRDCWWDELVECLERRNVPLRPRPAARGSDAAMLGAAVLAFSRADHAP